MQSILIVNTPADSQDLTALATVKAELGLTTSIEDTNLATWITQASATCANFCDRAFIAETVTETFRNKLSYPERGDRLRRIPSIMLARVPVVTPIVSIVEDGTPLTVDVDYQLDPTEGVIYRLDPNSDSLVNWFFQKLVINYTGGFANIAALPPSVQRACISAVVALRAGAGRDSTIKQESIPGVLETQYWVGGVGDNGALTPDVTAMLAPFRNVGV